MEEKRTGSVWIVVAMIALLLPVLYLGGYFALVLPDGSGDPDYGGSNYYRFGGEAAEKLFWPVERIDREFRPDAWWHLYHALEVG